MVDLGAIAAYEPRWPGVKELNLADLWRARWVGEQELPAGAPVHFVYALVAMGDKGYATRERGAAKWGMLEGEVGDAEPEAFLKAALKERMGGTVARIELIGFFECKPTRHNTEYKSGEITVRPLYLVVAKKVDDLPEDSAYERRRFPLNEYIVALRARYPEFLDHIGLAANRYGFLRAKGEA
jgi:hypothetical protein